MKSKLFVGTIVGSVVAIALAFLGLSSRWQFEREIAEAGSPPAALIEGYFSFQKPEDITNRLSANNLKWNAISDSKSSGNRFRPEFNELIISIPYYIHLENTGSLELVFNNGRLYQTVFYPDDLGQYLQRFSAHYNQKIELGKKINIGNYTIIESHKNYQNKIYIRWSDARILHEVSEWIKRFS